MNCSYIPIKQYNAPQKQLILVDDKPFCIARSPERARKILLYLEGYPSDLKDGKIIKMCDKVRKEHTNEQTKEN